MSEESPQQNPRQDAAKDNKKNVNWKIFFVVIATAALALWQIGDRFHGHLSNLFHCISVCGFLADGAYATHKSVKVKKRRKYIWLSLVIACGIVGAIYWLNGEEAPVSTSNTVIIVRQPVRETHSTKTVEWQPPELPEGCRDAWVTMGTFSAGWAISKLPDSPTNGPCAVEIDGLRIGKPYVKNHRLFVDVDIPINSGVIFRTVKLSGMRTIEVSQGWEMNHNSNAVEIVNEHFMPVYQVFYKSPNEVKVMGIFTGGQALYAFGENGMGMAPNELKPEWLGLKPIFKYPSGLHPGELAQ
jgi:hypothetical protein